MTIRLAMFDVDGTLKHEAHWFPGALELVGTLADAGVHIALCSGRAAGALQRLADELPGVTHLSGAGGTLVQAREGAGWRTLAEIYLPSASVPAIVAEAAVLGVELWAYTPTRWVVAEVSDAVRWDAAATGARPEVGELGTLPDVVKFVAVPQSDADRAACAALAGRHPVGVVGSHPRLIDIAPLAAVAHKGGDVLVEALGLEWADVFAAGDGANDVGMLSAAGLACLMPPLATHMLLDGPGVRFACADLAEVLAHVSVRLG